MSNFLCVNGLCSTGCLVRREGDNPEELRVIGSAEARIRNSSCASRYYRHHSAIVWRSEAQAMLVSSVLSAAAHFDGMMVILSSLQ